MRTNDSLKGLSPSSLLTGTVMFYVGLRHSVGPVKRNIEDERGPET